jgi:hypothetical protein
MLNQAENLIDHLRTVHRTDPVAQQLVLRWDAVQANQCVAAADLDARFGCANLFSIDHPRITELTELC